MDEPRVSHTGEGCVFALPDDRNYMALVCFLNGSLAREAVRDEYGLDWAGFTAALQATQPGNGGALMLPYFDPEIVPKVSQSNCGSSSIRSHRRTGQCPRRHRSSGPVIQDSRSLDGHRYIIALRNRWRLS